MKFDIGTIIAIAAALLFYLRLIVLQRQKVKIYRQTLVRRQGNKSGNTNAVPGLPYQGMLISNKFFVIGGALLLLLGAAAAGIPMLSESLRAVWWLPVSLGILLMGLGIR